MTVSGLIVIPRRAEPHFSLMTWRASGHFDSLAANGAVLTSLADSTNADALGLGGRTGESLAVVFSGLVHDVFLSLFRCYHKLGNVFRR